MRAWLHPWEKIEKHLCHLLANRMLFDAFGQTREMTSSTKKENTERVVSLSNGIHITSIYSLTHSLSPSNTGGSVRHHLRLASRDLRIRHRRRLATRST